MTTSTRGGEPRAAGGATADEAGEHTVPVPVMRAEHLDDDGFEPTIVRGRE
ncbi:hypothetical protein B0I33_107172 [Prauserella shujinwangii]|uniref:Uncharacterized protein n=1 Tax=Prauserella shujinwangii TaxID=1453103 RepID=A0A2T0LSK5_9PSEU|nr:hypothetical protein [Prauserella shujinwangii]PRX46595.1 hypothetical protein B0I33_107172 [Prauserella shujinwangii]